MAKDTKFKKGQSGNPNGKPKGGRNGGKKKAGKYEPTEAEKALIESHTNRQRQRRPAPRLKVKPEDGDEIVLAPDHLDPGVWVVGFNEAMGSTENPFAAYSFNQIISALSRKGEDSFELTERIGGGLGNSILAAMHGIAPKNEVEGMLAAQMVTVHYAAMNQMRLINSADTLEKFNCYANQANKLMRTYTAQMETLKRYRAKANQTVRVERVYVNEGGQAIVGNVQGGGGETKTEGQPHAKQVTHAPGTPLPSQDETGNIVPIPGDEKRKVPVARR